MTTMPTMPAPRPPLTLPRHSSVGADPSIHTFADYPGREPYTANSGEVRVHTYCTGCGNVDSRPLIPSTPPRDREAVLAWRARMTAGVVATPLMDRLGLTDPEEVPLYSCADHHRCHPGRLDCEQWVPDPEAEFVPTPGDEFLLDFDEVRCAECDELLVFNNGGWENSGDGPVPCEATITGLHKPIPVEN